MTITQMDLAQVNLFHKSHTSLGATGHWLKTAGMLAPLLIGEMVEDPEKRWRYIRMSAIATTLFSEAIWSHKIHKEREQAHERELDPMR